MQVTRTEFESAEQLMREARVHSTKSKPYPEAAAILRAARRDRDAVIAEASDRGLFHRQIADALGIAHTTVAEALARMRTGRPVPNRGRAAADSPPR